LRPHLPHFVSNAERASDKRLTLPQWLQTIILSLMTALPL
jgi:hypothetical protein